MKRLTVAVLAAVLFASPHLRAETYQSIPTVFYNTYSFAHPPALRIKPGDRVVTKVVDPNVTVVAKIAKALAPKR